MTVRNNPAPFEPRIVAFLCSWCSYAGADRAGTSQQHYPPNIRIIRVMCSGRVDPSFVLEAYKKGADGVIILACHPGECHYRTGNFIAQKRHRMLVRMLRQMGIGENRCRFDAVSASEGERLAGIFATMVKTVKRLGPLLPKL
jgi:F420-non-reducing hydrogenase iron-sulfur subunit